MKTKIGFILLTCLLVAAGGIFVSWPQKPAPSAPTPQAPALAEKASDGATELMSSPQFQEMTQGWTPRARSEAAAMIHLSRREYGPAIQILEPLSRQEPGKAVLWNLLSIAYNRVNEPRNALDAANAAIQRKPRQDEYYLERGIANFQLGNKAAARDDLARYRAAYPKDAESAYYLGLDEARLGRMNDARAHLLEARQLSPGMALMVDYYLGLIAAQQGKTAEARKLLQQTLNAFSDTKTPFKDQVRRQLQALKGKSS